MSIEIYRELHRNASTGFVATSSLLNRTTDESLRALMTRRLEKYKEHSREIEDYLLKNNVEIKEENPVKRASMKFGLAVNTAIDDSTSHIAEMMIGGANMSIIDLSRNRNSPDCSPDAADLCDRMIFEEEKTMRDLRQFL